MAHSKQFGYYIEAEEYYSEPEELRPEYFCEDCGQGIYEGDRFWKFEKYRYCEDCATNSFSQLA